MENFELVKSQFIHQLESFQAESHKVYNRLIEDIIMCQNWDEFQNIIINNYWFIDSRKLYDDIRLPDGHYKNPKAEFTLVDGKLHGKFVSYWSNGNVSQMCTYDNGQLHGEFVSYYENRLIWEKCTYVHGQRHGEAILYHDNGQVWHKYNYVNGKLHGEYVQYWSDGTVCEKCNFFFGEEHGEYVRYNYHGKVDKKCTYVHGQLVETAS
jgi:antitoxin component YwqK of YwqJK toxin-antitoxin module